MTDFYTKNAEYLLGRKIYDCGYSSDIIFGKTVLVTGGGGSIGSEICLQVARCGAEKIVIADINENNIHSVLQRLKYENLNTEAEAEVCSVRDRSRMYEIFRKYRPHIVIHAAAHKHVSMMENSPAEAVKNNIFGTVNTADAAEEYGVEKFVLVSTDKAVEPTNVMGATKRFCEYIVASRFDSATSFSAVRFGNVLGSAGSVVPDFIEAIRSDKPVRITDRDATRYFMTIPEAAGLVIKTLSIGKGGIYVLDMGTPVKIERIALKLGELLGKKPNIEYDSLSVGEKVDEKLFYGDPLPSECEFIYYESMRTYTRGEIYRRLDALSNCSLNGTDAKSVLKSVVEEYR